MQQNNKMTLKNDKKKRKKVLQLHVVCWLVVVFKPDQNSKTIKNKIILPATINLIFIQSVEQLNTLKSKEKKNETATETERQQ